jgi:hypothetical protein
MAKKSHCMELAFTSKEGHIHWQAFVEVSNALVLRKQTELVNKARPRQRVSLAALSDANRVFGRITRMRFGLIIDLR